MEGEYPYKIISYMIVIRNKQYSKLEEKIFRKSPQAYQRQMEAKQRQQTQQKFNEGINKLVDASNTSTVGNMPKANTITVGESINPVTSQKPTEGVLDFFTEKQKINKPTTSTPNIGSTPTKPVQQLSSGNMGTRKGPMNINTKGPLTYAPNASTSSPSLEIKPLNPANPGPAPVISPKTTSTTAAQRGAAWGKAMRPALTAATIGTIGLLAYNHFKNKDRD
jgi:hypothetical protein